MFSTSYVRVCEDESMDPVEVPIEPDNTLLLPTLTAQFPKCTGLKYKAQDSGCYRGLRLVGDCIYPPTEVGWGDIMFFCVFPKDNKRKSEEDAEDTKHKVKCLEGRKCTDLIVLNLAWHTDERTLREYFSQFGKLVMVQIKREPSTGKSRGYGFIRFNDYAGQVMCLAEQHMIDDRLCDVRIPLSKVEGDRQEVSRKIHVGRLTEDISAEVLRQHFMQYGRVIDVFIPKPFRSFAFVTFDDPDSAASLMGQDITIQGCSVSIGSAAPKLQIQNRQNGNENLSQMHSPFSPNQMTGAQLWNSGAWPAFGMFSNPTVQQNGNMPRNAAGPMGLNPAAAAAAATLAAQYTRAHQRQNAATAGGMGGGYMDRKGPGQDPNSSAALATLNILNNPNVVAAIVSAAAGAVGSPSYTNSGNR